MLRRQWAGAHLVVMVCLLGLCPKLGHATQVPPLAHRVTDLVSLIAPQEQARIEDKLKAYEMRTGRQFALLIVATLDDEPIEMFSERVFTAWKLGRKPQDDGLLMLIATQDHRMRIEVGYGLEPDVTDAVSSQVIHNILRPSFRSQAYADGIERAFAVLMAAADKSPIEGLLPQDDDGLSMEARWEWLVFAAIILILILTSAKSGPRRPGGGGPGLWLGGGGFGGDGFGGGSSGGGGFSGGGGSFGGGGSSGSW